MPLAITRNHRQRAAGQITQAAGEIAIRAIDQSLLTKSTVLAKNHFAQTEVAHRVDRKMSAQDIQLNCVAESLGHFATVRIEPHAVRDYSPWLFDAGGHQESGPVHRVE